MRERIAQINESLPAIFQIDEDGKELNLYIFGKDTETKSGNPIPIKTKSKQLFVGTKKERDAFIEGMHEFIEIAYAFNDFLNTVSGDGEDERQ